MVSVATLAWLVAVQAVAIFLFSTGFFLTRLELHDVSYPV